MAPKTKCRACEKAHTGRYTRKVGDTIPYFYCYACLPQGRGLDETPAPDQRRVALSPVDIPATREEGLALIQQFGPDVVGIVITDAEGYEAADTMLARISKARKGWGARMEKIIRPIRQGLDAIYELNRDVDKPLEGMEKTIRRAMADYKLEEHRQLQAAEEQKRRDEEQRRLEAEEARLKAERAATPQMRGRLEATAAKKELEADRIAMQETPAPVIADNSTDRTVKKIRVVDEDAFYKGLGEGYIPRVCAPIHQPALNKLLKDDPEGAAAMPGVEVYDDVEIVRR